MGTEIGGGAAGGAVSYLLVKFDAFARREWNLKKNINRARQDLEIEQRCIEALLRDADSNNDFDHQFTVWIQNVRNQDYAIKDVLDLFRIYQDQETVWRRFKMSHFIDKLIKDIKGSLQIIKEAKDRYHHTIPFTRIFPASSNTDLPMREAPLFNCNVEAVGIEEPTKKLIS